MSAYVPSFSSLSLAALLGYGAAVLHAADDTVLVSERFEYTAGTVIGAGMNTGVGWSGAWSYVNTKAGYDSVADATVLDYPVITEAGGCLKWLTGVGIGTSASWPSRYTLKRSFSPSATIKDDGSEYWIAFEIQTAVVKYNAGVWLAGYETAPLALLYSSGTSAPTYYALQTTNTGTTIGSGAGLKLFVFKIKTTAGVVGALDDVVTVFAPNLTLNPSADVWAAPANAIVTKTIGLTGDLTGIMLRSNNNGPATGTAPYSAYFDEFRVARSAAAAIGQTNGPVNQAPVAAAQSATTPHDVAKSLTLSATDADGNPLTYSIVNNPSHGTLSGVAPSITYTPSLDYTGTDSFTFKVNDGTVDSNVATVSLTIGADITAPAVITLAAPDATSNSVSLSWTAPGDDGSVGTAASYDVRYSTSNITSANFSLATLATGIPTPTAASTTQVMTVSGLPASMTYYFAIIAKDESGNQSALSNVVSKATQSLPPVTGSGNPGSLAKWSTTNTLGSSSITESAGNIGIGVSVPLAKLHVSSVDNQLATFNKDQPANNKHGAIVNFTANGTMRGRLGFTHNGSTPDTLFNSELPDVMALQGANGIQFATGLDAQAFARMTIGSNGNVGIGTSSPRDHNLLEIGAGTGTANLTINSGGPAYDGTIRFDQGSATKWIVGLNNAVQDDKYSFRSGGTEAMTLQTDGKVGIGTTAPNAAVHVHSSGVNDVLMHFTNATTRANSADGVNIGMDASEQAYFVNTENLGLVLGTNNTPRVTISAAGLVGIGVGTPSAQLHILEGDASAGPIHPSSILVLESNGVGETGESLVQFRSNTTSTNQGFVFGDSGSSDVGSIVYNHSDNALRFVVNASEGMIINSSGYVGIGTTSPERKLDIQLGNVNNSESARITSSGSESTLELNNVEKDGNNNRIGRSWQLISSGANGGLSGGNFAIYDPAFPNQSRLLITPSGNVGIGKNNPAYKLDVEGTIACTTMRTAGTVYAQEIQVDTNLPFPDYVFESNYKLRTLEEVEAAIKQDKRLPGVHSAEEIKKNGLPVASIITKQMEKIEELTLYAIEAHKQNEALKEKAAALEKRLAAIEAVLNQSAQTTKTAAVLP